MIFEIGAAWLVAVMLVSIRLGALFVLTPILGGVSVPLRVRIILIITLSAVLVTTLNAHTTVTELTVMKLFSAAIAEFIVGALLAFFVFCAFAAFMFAGRLIDMQIGFGVATLIDPVTRAQAPLIGTVFQLLAVTIFFALDGHHMIVRLLAEGIKAHPPGTFFPDIELGWLIAAFGTVFSLGLALVVPVIFMILLIDLSLALVSKTMPQMNVFIVAIPLKVFVGLIFLGLMIPQMGPVSAKIFTTMFHFWRQALSLNG